MKGNASATSTISRPTITMSRPAIALASYHTHWSADVDGTRSPYQRFGGTRRSIIGRARAMSTRPNARPPPIPGLMAGEAGGSSPTEALARAVGAPPGLAHDPPLLPVRPRERLVDWTQVQDQRSCHREEER